MSISALLETEIMDEFEALRKEEFGSEKYKVGVDGITKLLDRSIEIDKFENEEHYYLMHWELELSRLGLNISAILENAERFVWFKEREINYLLEHDEQAAKKEIEDWKDLLPYKI